MYISGTNCNSSRVRMPIFSCGLHGSLVRMRKCNHYIWPLGTGLVLDSNLLPGLHIWISLRNSLKYIFMVCSDDSNSNYKPSTCCKCFNTSFASYDFLAPFLHNCRRPKWYAKTDLALRSVKMSCWIPMGNFFLSLRCSMSLVASLMLFIPSFMQSSLDSIWPLVFDTAFSSSESSVTT